MTTPTPDAPQEESKTLDLCRMTADDLLANAEAVIKAASVKLASLCHGERWNMSVPVQNDDSDIPLGAVIRLANALNRARRVPAQEEGGTTQPETEIRELIRSTLAELDAYVAEVRNDWSDFDGRSNRRIVNSIVEKLRDAARQGGSSTKLEPIQPPTPYRKANERDFG